MKKKKITKREMFEIIAAGTSSEDIKEFCEKEIAALEPCLSLKGLAVNGKTLMANGIPEGKSLGAVLSALLGEVIDGKTKNSSEELIRRAKEIFEEQSGEKT